MINVIATIKLNDNCIDEFIELFNANVPRVLEEQGCIEYIPAIDFKTELGSQILDANTVTVIEKWASYEHLQAHFVAPHMLAYKAKVKDLVKSVSLRILTSALNPIN